MTHSLKTQPRLFRVLAAAFAAGALFCGAAAAQDVPITLVYQGTLTDLADAAIDDERAVTFRLYDAPDGGEPVWSERHPAVDVVGGQFTATLGQRTPIPPELGPAPTLFLSLQVEGDEEFAPRMPVGAALRAQWANRAGQADDVEGRHIHPSAITIGEVPIVDDAGRWVGPRDGFGGAGPQGDPGPQGVGGPDGPIGPQGPAGPQGESGVAGPAGPEGAAGPAGSAGPQGAPGDPGPAGVQGAQGPIGAAGLVGADGPRGPAGANGADGASGADGENGENGADGADGENGADGAMGPMGPIGMAPMHVWDGTTLRFALPDGNLADGVDLIGAAGAQGAAGAAGLAGAQGPAGVAGPAGAAGPQGSAGAQGVQGNPGPAGAAGDRGPAGAQGAFGELGPQGVAGAGGPAGARGAQGERGLPADPADFTRDTDQDGFPDWVEVAAGTDHDDINSRPADADNDGIADFFGGQPGGPGGDGAPIRYLDMAAGDTASCGLDVSGSIRCWGQGLYGEATPPAGTFTQVTLTDHYACGLRDDGEVVCWGGVQARAHVDPPAGAFIFVDAGRDWACGLRPAGTIECWGRAAEPPAGTYRHLSVGVSTACAIDDAGVTVCWGSNNFDQAEPPAGVEFVQVEAGNEISCGLRTDTATMECWGASSNEDNGRTPAGGTFIAFELNWDFNSAACGWRADGTVRCWGNRPGGIFPDRGVRQIAMGHNHACAIYLDGEAYCWGSNSSGQTDIP